MCLCWQVRKEMSLLTDVDQPGSAIDRYVEKLDAILKIKMDGILELKVRGIEGKERWIIAAAD